MTHRTGIFAVTSPSGRPTPGDGSFAEKIHELVERSGGQIRDDVAHA
jgi:hypothetical protein